MTSKCDAQPCLQPAEYHVVTGCLREQHVADFNCCLSHMVQIRAAFIGASEEPVYCIVCYKTRSVFKQIDDLMIENYDGQVISIDA